MTLLTFEVWLFYKGELGHYSWNQTKQQALKNPNSLEKKIITGRKKNGSMLLYMYFLMYEYFWFKGAKLDSL